MLTALSQSQAQDVFQLAEDAAEISRSLFKTVIVVDGSVTDPNARIFVVPSCSEVLVSTRPSTMFFHVSPCKLIDRARSTEI